MKRPSIRVQRPRYNDTERALIQVLYARCPENRHPNLERALEEILKGEGFLRFRAILNILVDGEFYGNWPKGDNDELL